MACYNPIPGYRAKGGGFTVNKKQSIGFTMQVPCKGCIGCRVQRAKEWAIRCLHEASLHDKNSFITLTYNDKHIPEDHGLKHADFQKFMKRLRFHFQGRIRYYMAGEYGNNPDGGLGRPHFHALLFGFQFPDTYIWDEKNRLSRSKKLEKLWPYGFATISDVNYHSAKYVAQYCMKKITGNMAEQHYRKVDTQTGEIYQVQPEYNAMSLKPGIAYDWYLKYNSDVYPSDFIVIDGKKQRTPAYYLRLLEQHDPDMFQLVKSKRLAKAKEQTKDNTPERLAVRENLQKSAQNRNQRTLQ